jgi:hypothetical protein
LTRWHLRRSWSNVRQWGHGDSIRWRLSCLQRALSLLLRDKKRPHLLLLFNSQLQHSLNTLRRSATLLRLS